MTTLLTRIRALRPALLSKSVRRGLDGHMVSKAGGLLVEGEATVQSVGSLTDLATLLQSMGPADALTFGVPRNGDCRILSRSALALREPAPGATTRTRDQFVWPNGPGIMMLDHDPGDTPIGREALVELVRDAVPGLREAAMLWWPSASSHIFDVCTGEDLTGLRGQRLYLIARDAADIPRAGARLVDRLWAAGHGYISVSSAGMGLERCPVDSVVWQPERLDLAAGAHCHEGLEQRRGAPWLVPGHPDPVDTKRILGDDPIIAGTAQTARRRARDAASADLEVAREAYLGKMSRELLPSDPNKDNDDGEALDDARRTIQRALDRNVLSADFLIDVERAPGQFERTSVKRILDAREDFHGCVTRDPLEPDYDGGRCVGKLYLLDARPTLFSFARGGRSFRLLGATDRIEVPRGRLSEATEAAIRVLQDDPAIFDFGGQIVLVERDTMNTLDEHSLGYHIAGSAQFWQYRTVKGQAVPTDIDPPAKMIRQILSLGRRRGLKPLNAIATCPTLRPDGSVLTVPGYDTSTGLLVSMDEISAVRDVPDHLAIRRALSDLTYPFVSFPLADRLARGAMLSALLTAVVRPSLPTSPAFAVDAPVQGAGKTLLASCFAALATGHPPDIWPHTAARDDEETRKRLFTALRDGAGALVWDNITGVFDSAALASAITAPVVRDRILGHSESRTIQNRTLILLTGNNFCPAGDLMRRVIPISIDPATDTPFAREFELDPLEYVLEHRQHLACAALVLMRGWLSSGAQRAAGRTASFETWDDLVRQTVCWINSEIAPGEFCDPLDLIRTAQGNDPDQESLFALLEALRSLFGKNWFSARMVKERANGARPGYETGASQIALAEALADLGGERALASSRSLGRMLRFREGRIVFGLRLCSRSGRNGRDYRVEDCETAMRSEIDGAASRLSSPLPVPSMRPQLSESNPPNPPNSHPADPEKVEY